MRPLNTVVLITILVCLSLSVVAQQAPQAQTPPSQAVDIEKAHDAIVDILQDNFEAYKVTRPDYPKNQRHYNGAQFTLYLSEKWENETEKLEKVQIYHIKN